MTNDRMTNDRFEYINDQIFWRYADDIRRYVFEYLEKQFPEAFIIDELDRIDISVLDENLPVEIQGYSSNTT